MEVAESILPGTLERTLNNFDKQQEHDHKIDNDLINLHEGRQRQERSDSRMAFCVIIFFGGFLGYMLILGMITEASIFGGFFLGLAALARVMRRSSK